MLGRNIHPVGVVVAQCLGQSFSRCLFDVLKKMGGVFIYSQTGVATPYGAIFKEKCYGSICGIILHVRVIITRTSFSLMGLVKPQVCRGTGGGRVKGASTRGSGAASCVCRGMLRMFSVISL